MNLAFTLLLLLVAGVWGLGGPVAKPAEAKQVRRPQASSLQEARLPVQGLLRVVVRLQGGSLRLGRHSGDRLGLALRREGWGTTPALAQRQRDQGRYAVGRSPDGQQLCIEVAPASGPRAQASSPGFAQQMHLSLLVPRAMALDVWLEEGAGRKQAGGIWPQTHHFRVAAGEALVYRLDSHAHKREDPLGLEARFRTIDLDTPCEDCCRPLALPGAQAERNRP